MTSTTGTAAEADRALKARHRAMWAMGDYPALATDLLPQLGPVLVEACAVRSGDSVLDVAAGSGIVSIAAAATGADVVASDLTPKMFEAGRGRGGGRGGGMQGGGGGGPGGAVPPPPPARGLFSVRRGVSP